MMKYLYKTVCNGLFELTNIIINWCIVNKKWKLASKIVSIRLHLIEIGLQKSYPTEFLVVDSNQIMTIITEKTNNFDVIRGMEITASNSMYNRHGKAAKA
jgi:hypothetical protein